MTWAVLRKGICSLLRLPAGAAHPALALLELLWHGLPAAWGTTRSPPPATRRAEELSATAGPPSPLWRRPKDAPAALGCSLLPNTAGDVTSSRQRLS